MVDAAIAERVEALRREINNHNYRYYVLDDPDVSDSHYDQLMRDLRWLEEAHPGIGDQRFSYPAGRCCSVESSHKRHMPRRC